MIRLLDYCKMMCDDVLLTMERLNESRVSAD